MPRKSEKNQIVEYLIEDAAEQILWIEENESRDEADEVMEVFDELNEKLAVVLACRRGVNFESVPKCTEWLENILLNMNDERFLQMLRTNRNQFNHLITLIREAEVFNGPHFNKQFSIQLQLAVVLFRLGSYGGNAAVRKIATLFGIGDGGTIAKITNRIFQVILKLKSKFLYWPNCEERSEIVAASYHELPLCIGYVDGTEIKLAEAPVLNHECFFSRKHQYSIKAQVVCDYKLHIRDVVVGSPGSVHDAKIFKNCSLNKNKSLFFSNDQWLAGDSAYQLSDIMITPYRMNSKQLSAPARKMFNLRHSKYRVRVEHCFGLLKEKFESLKQLRMRTDCKENHALCCQWIVVCCILHNILLEEKELDKFTQNSLEHFQDDDNNLGHSSHNFQFEAKRQGIYHLIF